jgi:hypothetical protein
MSYAPILSNAQAWEKLQKALRDNFDIGTSLLIEDLIMENQSDEN